VHAALRPYVTAGVALVGASVIVVTPIAPPPPEIRSAELAVRLAAATSSIANVPVNLIDAIASVPANEVLATQDFANSLLFTGTWWVYTPTNVLGTDPGDPPKLKGLIEMALPFPALSGPIAAMANAVQEAELPMNAGCSAIPGGCPDPVAILSSMFQILPLLQMLSPGGYTFPTVIDPSGAVQGAFGFPGTGPGNTTAWSGTTVHLDPLAPITSAINSLMAPPSGITTVTPAQITKAPTDLVQGLWIDFYPFVPNSEIFNPQNTILAYLFRPLAPILCGAGCQLPPASVTSIPSLTPGSGQTFTINTAAVAPGGDVTNNGAKNDVVAGTATNSPSNAAGVLDTVSNTVAPGADQGLGTATTAVEQPQPTTTTSTNLTRGGNKVEPGQLGGNGTKSGGGLAGAVKSVSDQINSAISNVTNGLKGGSAQTGGTGTGTGGTGTGGTGTGSGGTGK
jgi:hypothetical protein